MKFDRKCIAKYFQADVREDEEQTKRFQDIIDLLLAAGYFRARIKGLSNFDKVRMKWIPFDCCKEHTKTNKYYPNI